MSGQEHITVGQELTVTLDTIPSSGYRWVVQSIPDALVKVGEIFQDQEQEGYIGGHALHSMTFMALGIGTYTLVFELRRPWEKEVAPLKLYSLEVLVT